MSRYLSSFFITSMIYFVSSFSLYFAFSNIISIQEKQEDNITKISLNSVEVAVSEPIVEPVVEPIIEPVVEVEPEIIPEPIVQKPTPVKKQAKPKKKPQQQKPPKPVEHQEVAENIQQTEPTKTVAQTAPKTPRFSQYQVSSIKDKYLAKVYATIEKNKIYPRVAKRLNQTGKVHVNFDIMRNGAVKNIKIEKGSKFDNLDKASIELLLTIASFDAIPEELEKDIWNITIPIVYQIN